MLKENAKDTLNPKICDVACRHILLEMTYPRTRWDVESFLWYMYHEDCEVFIDEHFDWYLAVRGRCKNLTRDERCAVKNRQPGICAEFSDYEAKSIGELATHHFINEKQLLKYLKKKRPRLFKKLTPQTRAVIGG